MKGEKLVENKRPNCHVQEITRVIIIQEIINTKFTGNGSEYNT